MDERRSPSTEELVDVVDGHDQVLGQAPRSQVYYSRLRHRCVFVLVRDDHGRIFVHRRPATKRVFPACYDMVPSRERRFTFTLEVSRCYDLQGEDAAVLLHLLSLNRLLPKTSPAADSLVT